MTLQFNNYHCACDMNSICDYHWNKLEFQIGLGKQRIEERVDWLIWEMFDAIVFAAAFTERVREIRDESETSMFSVGKGVKS